MYSYSDVKGSDECVEIKRLKPKTHAFSSPLLPQPFVSPPPYIGVNLTVEGQAIKKTGTVKKQCSTNHVSLLKPKNITPGVKDKDTPLDSDNIATAYDNGKDTALHSNCITNARNICKDTPLHSHDVITPGNNDKTLPTNSNTEDNKKKEGHKNINVAKTSGKCSKLILGAGSSDGLWTGECCVNAMQKKYSVLVDDAKFRKKESTNERIKATQDFPHTPRVMAVPKAILRYSTAKTLIPQSSVSIGFSTSTKQV